MKRFRIEWSPFALKCLNEIHEYISNEAKSAVPANRLIGKLFERVDILATHPFTGQSEDYLEGSGVEGRYLVEGSYKIIYHIREDTVEILDVFHTKQNPKKIKRRAKK